ncbi:MAG: hypothetical protein KGO81_14805 [Bacteroidota bacterium]|nr:hypothetical protein [Bacteroidota bacterium]
MKKIAYSVCSANHLAYAKTMADSFTAHHPEYSVIIGLVDRIEGRFGVAAFQPYIIIEAEEMGITKFAQMSQQYTIIELNCAIKPFLAQYIFNTYQPEILLYLDTDIFIYQPLLPVERLLEKNDIVLTPHFTTPVTDEKEPRERDILRSGLYNAGFIGMKKSTTVDAFLQWWSSRLVDQCYYNFAEGMGVDQNWLNLVPLFFDNVAICHHKGINVAYWNLHERVFSVKENLVMVNEKEPLIFLHISGYKFNFPDQLSLHQTRFVLSELPILKKLLDDYRSAVNANGYERFIHLSCYFSKPKKKSTGLMATVNKLIKPLGIKITNV